MQDTRLSERPGETERTAAQCVRQIPPSEGCELTELTNDYGDGSTFMLQDPDNSEAWIQAVSDTAGFAPYDGEVTGEHLIEYDRHDTGGEVYR